MATTGPVGAEFGFGTPWAEQLAFFRRKLNLPTEWWDDIQGAAHDRAFIVAGVAKADLLQDLRGAMDSAMESGGLAGFRKQFKALVASHGWTGWTGEGSARGEAWRTRIIYQTNMATSYAAGRYKQLTEPEFAKLRPYWKYVHADGQLHPRPLHLAWHGLTLPMGHPFWKTHFAPNGWHCFPADMAVRCAARIGLKTWYSGEMVELSTAGRNRLTVTANHPVLTSLGWVCAHELQEGDELIGCAGQLDTAFVGVVDHEEAPTRAEDLFESLAAEGLRIAPMAPHDFHGDAILRKAEIHIAGADGALVDVRQAARGEFIGKGGLEVALHRRIEAADVAAGSALAAPIKCNAVLAQHVANGGLRDAKPLGDLCLTGDIAAIQRQHLALHGSVACVGHDPGRAELSLDAAGRRFDGLPPDPLGLGLPAQRDARTDQGAPEQVSSAVGLFRELLEANPTKVARDKIVKIWKYQWAGHVYDFVTTTGLILAGGVVVSNCRCEIPPVAAPAAGAATEPPAGWDTVNAATGAPPGIDKGFAYAPGAGAQTALRQLVQDKLITYPPAIAKALSVDVNRRIAADVDVAGWVRTALADAAAPEQPLWLGFVQEPDTLAAAAGADTQGFMITLPASTARHVRNSRRFDGAGQRAPQPEDFAQIEQVLNAADSLRAGEAAASGAATVVATKAIDGEVFRAVFEVLTGKRNRALALLSLVIKTTT